MKTFDDEEKQAYVAYIKSCTEYDAVMIFINHMAVHLSPIAHTNAMKYVRQLSKNTEQNSQKYLEVLHLNQAIRDKYVKNLLTLTSTPSSYVETENNDAGQSGATDEPAAESATSA